MSRLRPRVILLAGWLLFLLYAYPGYMGTDGADQIIDARVGVFSDWHSPMLTQVWQIVELAIAGPAGMLVLQSGLTLLGAFWLLRRVMAERAAAIAAACAIVFPPVMVTLAVISPQALLGGLLLVAIELVSSDCRKRKVGGVAILVVAAALCDGGALASLPILIAYLRVWPASRGMRRIGIALLAWIVIVVASIGVERAIVDWRSHRSHIDLAVFDLVGTLRFASPLDDRELTELMAGVPLASTTNIQARARQVYGQVRFYDYGELRLLDPVATDAQREALFAARRALMRAAPGGYLRQRWQQLFRVLGISRMSGQVYFQFVATFPGDAETLGHMATHSVVQTALIRAVEPLATTFWFRPYIYFFIALLVLPIAIRRKHHIAIVLLASALAYELTLMFTTVTAEYRDSHWMIVATVLAVTAMIGAAWRQRSERRNERVSGEAALGVAHDNDVELDRQRL